jgi:hypothetical protein
MMAVAVVASSSVMASVVSVMRLMVRMVTAVVDGGWAEALVVVPPLVVVPALIMVAVVAVVAVVVFVAFVLLLADLTH